MKHNMCCNSCGVAYAIRATPFDSSDDRAADGFDDPEAELSPDYCPFCGQLAEED